MRAEVLEKFYEFAVETTYLAGRLTLSYFQTALVTKYKNDRSPVTIADQKAEELIRSRIEQAYPGHAIVGEEFGINQSSHSHRWLIDPIDGTKSFLRGVPLYAVLLGLEIEGVVQVGAAYFPAMDEMIAAATDRGCWWNGRRAHVSQAARLNQAVFSTTSVKTFEKTGQRAVFERLCRACYYQVGWGDAYGYLLVATGRADLMVDAAMQVWDCGPFPPILSEAGGFFGDWEGKPSISSGNSLATTNALLPEVLQVIHSSNP
jgi:myo-inositol-1(or 4)-monophosphatase